MTGNLPTGQNSLPEKKNGQMYDFIRIHDPWPRIWLDGQELRMNTTEKLVTRRFGEEV